MFLVLLLILFDDRYYYDCYYYYYCSLILKLVMWREYALAKLFGSAVNDCHSVIRAAQSALFASHSQCMVVDMGMPGLLLLNWPKDENAQRGVLSPVVTSPEFTWVETRVALLTPNRLTADPDLTVFVCKDSFSRIDSMQPKFAKSSSGFHPLGGFLLWRNFVDVNASHATFSSCQCAKLRADIVEQKRSRALLCKALLSKPW